MAHLEEQFVTLIKSFIVNFTTKRFKDDRTRRWLLAQNFISKITIQNNLRWSACPLSPEPLGTFIFLAIITPAF